MFLLPKCPTLKTGSHGHRQFQFSQSDLLLVPPTACLKLLRMHNRVLYLKQPNATSPQVHRHTSSGIYWWTPWDWQFRVCLREVSSVHGWGRCYECDGVEQHRPIDPGQPANLSDAIKMKHFNSTNRLLLLFVLITLVWIYLSSHADYPIHTSIEQTVFQLWRFRADPVLASNFFEEK